MAPTKQWPLPGIKRKGALELYRTNSRPGKPRSIAEMVRDVARTNPNYYSDESFRINCQRVVQAYELRTRGYDVTANPNPGPGVGPKFTDERIFGGWNADGLKVEAGTNFVTAKSAATMNTIAQTWGPGARGWICVDWKLMPGQPASKRSAHIFNVEVATDGTVRYCDAQSGQGNAAMHLANIDFKHSRHGARMYRVDDVTPVDETRTLVTPEPSFILPTQEVPR